MLHANDVERFARDGYLIVRNVFSPEEIDQLRGTVERLSKELPSASSGDDVWSLPGDLASFPELAPLLADPRLLEIAHDLLRDRPIYFRDSSIDTSDTVKDHVRGWHKDNRVPDRYDPLTPDWDGDYPIIRMALYCEDHVEHSGGISLRAGSHRAESSPLRKLLWGAVHKLRPRAGVRAREYGITTGKAIHAPTKAGDLAVWTLRTSHSGFTLRPRWAKNLKLSPRLEDVLPGWLFLPGERPRISIFVSYGAASTHLDRLLKFLPTRDYFPERNLSRPVCAEGFKAFAEQGDSVVLLESGAFPEQKDAESVPVGR